MYKVNIRIIEKNKSRNIYQWVDSKKLRALRTIHGNENVTITLTAKGE